MPQRISIGLVGPSTHTNIAHQSARTINLYPEMGDDGAKSPVALFQTPGLLLARDLSTDAPGAAEVRGCYTMPSSDRLFVVAGNSLVEVRSATSFYVWGYVPTNSGPVGISSNSNVVIVGDGTGFWAFDLAAGTVAAVLSSGDRIRGWFSAYLDGRTLYLEKDTDRFYYSALNDPTTVDGLNFATAEGNPDPAVAMFVTNREISFLGKQSVEFWAPTGDSDNPFARVSGGYRDLGCAARWGAKPFADAVIFIGQDKSGHAQIYLQGPAGGSPDPISNHAVEKDIRVALRDYDIEDIRSFEYTEPGHKFWVLSLPTDITWAWDIATRQWHERAELDTETGLFKKLRQEHHAFWRGEHYVGGSSSAKLYKQSKAYNDLTGTDALVRRRETPVLWAKGSPIRIHSVELAMSVGIGTDGAGQGSDPKIMMQYSRDGGETWSNEIWRSIGKIGNYLTRVKFGPCGFGYNFAFRFTVSDPVNIVMVEGWADATIG